MLVAILLWVGSLSPVRVCIRSRLCGRSLGPGGG